MQPRRELFPVWPRPQQMRFTGGHVNVIPEHLVQASPGVPAPLLHAAWVNHCRPRKTPPDALRSAAAHAARLLRIRERKG